MDPPPLPFGNPSVQFTRKEPAIKVISLLQQDGGPRVANFLKPAST